MTARAQRLAELHAARVRIDEQIRRLAPDADLPEANPFDHIATRRLADLAVHMVQHGATHDEIATAMHMPRASVSLLIAGQAAHRTERRAS
ncbi:hypothetical protein [Cellulomonas shaoxiangyii]|uniref:Uncharacterized protein n=1 Tax=Cellulomonas shaoxiangyii TaxID=2566013 RepID=A0A4P7SGN8_9CELL|nr:hypothetical protein [Cellulomonas shaoxiangyii]QCB93319.1 hypothetical protein E5225_06905 [Cellulomonas shaoxiangyii]TGY79424.1 hypothetical protein E5226_15435 [Cellulomonas shaoxiangyii]